MAADEPDILGQQWHQLFDDLQNETGIRVGNRTMPGTTSHGLHLPDYSGLPIAAARGGILHIPGMNPSRKAEFMAHLPIDTASGPSGAVLFEGGFNASSGAPEMSLHTPQGTVTTNPEQHDPSTVVNEHLGIYDASPERILSAIPQMLAHSAHLQGQAPLADRQTQDTMLRSMGMESRGGRFLKGQISYLPSYTADVQSQEEADRALSESVTFPRGYDFRKRRDIDQYEEG